jgi:hypothetical protein
LPYGPFNFCLTRLECLVDRHLAGQGGSDVLANLQADGLKLWYPDKLYSDVRDLLNSRVRRVSRLHGFESYRSEWCRFLVFGIVVSRLACAGRDSRPTSVLRRQLDVFLGRGPQGILQGGI